MRKNDPNAGINIEKINAVKAQLESLKEKGEPIHVNFIAQRNKLKNMPADIVAIYPSYMQIKSQIKNYYERFTVTYIDILIKNIEIVEVPIEK